MASPLKVPDAVVEQFREQQKPENLERGNQEALERIAKVTKPSGEIPTFGMMAVDILAELRKHSALLGEIRDRLPKPQTSTPVIGTLEVHQGEPIKGTADTQ